MKPSPRIRLLQIRATLLAFFVATTAGGQPAVPEFSGYLTNGRQSLFALTDRDAQASSGWLSLGQAFQGYTLSQYDSAEQVLVLKHAAGSIRVPLKTSRVLEARPKSTPRATSSGVDGGVEVQMTLSADGVFSLHGHPFSAEALNVFFATMAREVEGVLLVVEVQYPKEKGTSRDLDLLKSITSRLKAAGFKRGAVNTNYSPTDS